MEELNFNLTVSETNIILEGLGHLPYSKVFSVIAKIQSQAQEQIHQKAPAANGEKAKSKAESN